MENISKDKITNEQFMRLAIEQAKNRLTFNKTPFWLTNFNILCRNAVFYAFRKNNSIFPNLL